MKRVHTGLRLLLIITLVGLVYERTFAQAPIIVETTIDQRLDEGVIVKLFGIFFTGSTNVSFGDCNCEILPEGNDLGYVNDDLNLFCFLSSSCGPVNALPMVTNAGGTGTGFFNLVVDFPAPTPYMPFLIVDDETVPDSLIHQVRVETLGDEEALTIERGYFQWTVDNPVPDPIPLSRFADPANTLLLSSRYNWNYTDDEFESAMASVGYFVRVDESLVEEVEVDGSPKFRKRTYFTLADPFPNPEYPLNEGLNILWEENIGNISEGISQPVYGDFDVVTPNETFNFDIHDVNFYNVFGLEYEQTYEQTGLSGYFPNYLFTMDQLNGPFPTIEIENVSLYNEGGITTYLEGRTLEISTPQTYKKYFGTINVNESISAGFYLQNLTDSILDYETIEVVISGDDASSFSVSQQPATDVEVSGQSLFTISFTPTTAKLRHEAVVTINTDEFSYYSFPIVGFALPQLTVSITSTLSGPTNQTTIPIQIQFSEEVSGFESTDLVLVNATISDFTTNDNITFTANLSPTTDGEVTVNLPEASATNDLSTPNTAAAEFSIVYNSAPSTATVALTVYLEGAYNGTDLNTTLNGSIPTSQPYSFNGHSGGSAASIPANAVDWVLVELREAGSAAEALSSTKVGSAAGFLMSDGTIKATDGTSDLTISLSENSGADFFVVVYHRNHLPIMSANAISDSGGTYTIDFTTNSSNTYQTTNALASLSGGKFGMPAGDTDGDGDIDATDLGTWRNSNGAVFSYVGNGVSDFNLDGVINAVDRNMYWKVNNASGKASQVPTTI